MMMVMIVQLQVIVECNEVLGCLLYLRDTTSTTVSCKYINDQKRHVVP